MLAEMVKASLLIFLAELGDKTQILAMAFALQYSVRQVLLGVALGAFLNHGLAVIVGSYLAHLIPLSTIRLASALMFLGFGLWTLYSDEEHSNGSNKRLSSPILVVALAFFLGELGDKTQLTAIALASNSAYPAAVLAGTVLGMVLVSLGGIFVGTKLGGKIPELALKLVSSFVFIGFGIFHLVQAVPQRLLNPASISLFVLALGAAVLIPVLQLLRSRAAAGSQGGQMQRIARQLHSLDRLLDQICLGDENCRSERCPVGYCKKLIKAELNGSAGLRRTTVVQPYVRKDQRFDRRKLEEALSLVERSDLSPELRAELKTNLEKLFRPV